MERFVVGTGRCGSTLLSRMLAQHPAVLSLFEFFTGLDATARFAPQPISGAAFAQLIGAEQPFVTAVVRRGYPVEEVVYPYRDDGHPGSRYCREDPVPWLLVTLLPRLTEEPDALFDATLARARQHPEQAARDHYLALFAWLAEQLGRPCWIERSGSSIDYLGDLATAFPAAKFLHIHRDGREVALSMRGHHAYRLPISLLYDVPLDTGLRVSESAPFDVHAPPTDDDTVTTILRSTPPPEAFGRYWSDQITRGAAAARRLGPDRYREVSFEALVAEPARVLARIGTFFELPRDGDWLDAAAALVRRPPVPRFPRLGRSDQRSLEAACAEGSRLLGTTD